ncbi:hypothetical protein DICPUDRAFT_155452, partial [Dictyostelium purpureum]
SAKGDTGIKGAIEELVKGILEPFQTQGQTPGFKLRGPATTGAAPPQFKTGC